MQVQYLFLVVLFQEKMCESGCFYLLILYSYDDLQSHGTCRKYRVKGSYVLFCVSALSSHMLPFTPYWPEQITRACSNCKDLWEICAQKVQMELKCSQHILWLLPILSKLECKLYKSEMSHVDKNILQRMYSMASTLLCILSEFDSSRDCHFFCVVSQRQRVNRINSHA